MAISITRSEQNVEMVRESFSFFSNELANGRNKSAIKKEKKSGDKTPFPIFDKYPRAKILSRINGSRRTKGSLISFISQINDKIIFEKENASNI